MVKFIILLTLISSTTNALAQWISIDPGTPNEFTDVYFINDSVGFVSGDFGTVLSTSNGGNSWVNIGGGLNSSLVAICAVDQDTIYSSRDSLYKSTDGGGGWSEVGGFGSLLWSISDIEFIGAKTGFVIKGSNIYKSSDFGNSWSQVFSGSFIKNMQFLNDSVGFAYGGFVNPPAYSGLIVKSTDYGNSWDSLYGSYSLAITASHFINEDSGYFFADPPALYSSTNGGEDWSILNANPETGQIADCYFLNSVIGYAIGWDGNVYKTIDGGLNWNTDHFGTGFPLLSIFVVDSTAYAVGSYATILKNKGFVTQIKENDINTPKLIVHPNPTSGLITLTDLSPETTRVTVYNVLGERIRESELDGLNDSFVDLSAFPDGIYLIQLENSQGQWIRKIIKQ